MVVLELVAMAVRQRRPFPCAAGDHGPPGGPSVSCVRGHAASVLHRPRGGAHQAVVLGAARWVAHARSRSTAAAAATSAAASAIRVICQPGMPPVTMVCTGGGAWTVPP